MSQHIRVGISIGDINGIGVEIIMKSLEDARMLESITPVIYGSARIFSYYRKALNLNNFNYIKIAQASEAKDKQINLVNLWEEEIKINVGESTKEGGEYAFKSLKAATNDIASGKIDVLITAPINKKNIQSEEFNFPGHTEYLTKFANAEESLMLMVNDNLRVGLVTNHVPLTKITEVLTKEAILGKLQLLNQSLQKDFGIVKPKIAVLGLNPHAGENGMIGDEEQQIIGPAVEMAQKSGILAFGPYASDGLFGSGKFTQFDGVLAMYHDQGLTPFKALAGGTGINYTAGLPIVRTSPDHGTAYEIAGQGIASEESFRNAIYLACDIFQNRKKYKQMTVNPLIALEKEMER
jgi:4-hydroxythreonine-4-phosphate dehydrogenase